jgi:hypothetical protein
MQSAARSAFPRSLRKPPHFTLRAAALARPSDAQAFVGVLKKKKI